LRYLLYCDCSILTWECALAGSCYGAESKEKPCCQSCDEIREEYRKRGWAFHATDSMEQVCAAAVWLC